MKFQNITGVVNKVPLEIYKQLIDKYVAIVSRVDGVTSIIQMGSFTTPGLSDIDLIVVVKDENPPKWEDISIKNILKGEVGYEVIAHDIFLYPESIAKYIEALYYIDKKNVLYGKNIGEVLSDEYIGKLKVLLSFEHTVHSLEALISLTSLPSITLRNSLLFFSTLRHTYKLLYSFDLISKIECDHKISEIENLREQSFNRDSKSLKLKLNEMIAPSFKVLYDSILLFGNLFKYDIESSDKSWILNDNKLIFNIDTTFDALLFYKKIDKYNKLFKGKFLLITFPSLIQYHIEKYRSYNVQRFSVIDERLKITEMRFILAMNHKAFISKYNYPIHGTYTIIRFNKTGLNMKIKFLVLKIFKAFLIKKNS